MNIFESCPTVSTKNFTLRLIESGDSDSLFECYNDEAAVRFMNDDNCDFGFFTESREKMVETVGYWLDFYRQGAFVRFAIVDTLIGKAIGTIEGFCGEAGVVRVDIASAYEKGEYLSELFKFTANNFSEYFGNEYLVTKAVPKATERRKALERAGWDYIDDFRGFHDYYRLKI